MTTGRRNKKNKGKRSQSGHGSGSTQESNQTQPTQEISQHSAAPLSELPPMKVYPCTHQKAWLLRYAVDIMRYSVKIEPIKEKIEPKKEKIEPKKYRVKFIYDAYVDGSITLYFSQIWGEDQGTIPTMKKLLEITTSVKKGLNKKFEQEGDGVSFPLYNKGLTEVYHLSITTHPDQTPLTDKKDQKLHGSQTTVTHDQKEIVVSQTTLAVIEKVKGKIKVRVTNQIVKANDMFFVCHDHSGFAHKMDITNNDPRCLLCLLRENPGVHRPIGKISLTRTPIGTGHNGVTVHEGTYDDRPVAVKKIPKEAYRHDLDTRIQCLMKYDHHPNIVGLYGKEDDDKFVYLALQRCKYNLDDLISNRHDTHWEKRGNEWYPSEGMLKILRDLVAGIAFLHEHQVTGLSLELKNVLIHQDLSITAKLCIYKTGTASSEWQADIFRLGILLLKVITHGKDLVGVDKEDIDNISNRKKKKNLDLLNRDMREAYHLIFCLLDPDLGSRPKAAVVYNHPFFWSLEKVISFLKVASDRVDSKDSSGTSQIVDSLEEKGIEVFGKEWNQKVDRETLTNSESYRHYDYSSLRDLLRLIRNILSHHGISSDGAEKVVKDFRRSFPKLLIEVYKVLKKYCEKGEAVHEYLE